MNSRDLVKGFALICGEDGRIKAVAHDSSGIFGDERRGWNISLFGGEKSSAKLLDFLALANSVNKAAGWRISLKAGSDQADYSLWGIKQDGDIYIIGIAAPNPLKEAREYFSDAELARGLEGPFRAVEEMVFGRMADDAAVYDELTRLNNELINLQRELTKNNRRLQEALDNIKTLKGLVPICSSCKKIRNDGGYWQQVEEYVAEHTEADFSHGLCDECAHKLYPEIFKGKVPEQNKTGHSN
jgi:hypothetical protein